MTTDHAMMAGLGLAETTPGPLIMVLQFVGFGAVVAICAWVAMERFKIGVIPTLGACAVLGMIWKLTESV